MAPHPLDPPQVFVLSVLVLSVLVSVGVCVCWCLCLLVLVSVGVCVRWFLFLSVCLWCLFLLVVVSVSSRRFLCVLVFVSISVCVCVYSCVRVSIALTTCPLHQQCYKDRCFVSALSYLSYLLGHESVIVSMFQIFLGITFDGYPEVLHLLFIRKVSGMPMLVKHHSSSVTLTCNPQYCEAFSCDNTAFEI